MFIPSTFKRPVSSWKALNLRKTLLMASSVRLKPLNCSRLPCVYAQETLTFLLTQKKDRKSGSAGMPRPISYAVFCLKKKKTSNLLYFFTATPLATDAADRHHAGTMAESANQQTDRRA